MRKLNPLQLLSIIFGLCTLAVIFGLVLPAMVSAANTMVALAGLFLTAVVAVFVLYYGYSFVKEKFK